jgi:hypothetical protein
MATRVTDTPVDAQQDLHAVPARSATSVAGTPALSHNDTAAWRRSYGRPASGEATCSGVSARVRACAQTSLIAVYATWPRSLAKTRPSGVVPKMSMCSRRIATSGAAARRRAWRQRQAQPGGPAWRTPGHARLPPLVRLAHSDRLRRA